MFIFARYNSLYFTYWNFFRSYSDFINGELIGKVTEVKWSIIFPAVDLMPRHPSQLYETFRRIVLFIIMNVIIFRKNYKIEHVISIFNFYGSFRIISEFLGANKQIGYLFNFLSMGSILSIIMIFIGILFLDYLQKNDLTLSSSKIKSSCDRSIFSKRFV